MDLLCRRGVRALPCRVRLCRHWQHARLLASGEGLLPCFNVQSRPPQVPRFQHWQRVRVHWRIVLPVLPAVDDRPVLSSVQRLRQLSLLRLQQVGVFAVRGQHHDAIGNPCCDHSECPAAVLLVWLAQTLQSRALSYSQPLVQAGPPVGLDVAGSGEANDRLLPGEPLHDAQSPLLRLLSSHGPRTKPLLPLPAWAMFHMYAPFAHITDSNKGTNGLRGVNACIRRCPARQL